MKIDSEKLKSYLAKLKSNPCPLCGETKWAAQDEIFQIICWDNSFPAVIIVCENCGKMHFVSGVISGLYGQEQDHEVSA